MTAIDIRHAGGAVIVEPGGFLEQAVVRLKFPGCEVPLYPEEARRLCVALVEAAHKAEHPAVDDWMSD